MLQQWDGPYVGVIAYCDTEEDAHWLAQVLSRQLQGHWLNVFGPSGHIRTIWVKGAKLR